MKKATETLSATEISFELNEMRGKAISKLIDSGILSYIDRRINNDIWGRLSNGMQVYIKAYQDYSKSEKGVSLMANFLLTNY